MEVKKVDFRARINALLKEKNISQAELCRRSGVTTAAMSKYSTGIARPTFDTAIAIALALDISLDELVGWKPKQLTEQERDLLDMFRELDADERNQIFDYTEYKHRQKFLREQSSTEAGENSKGA